jgi:hypothetical protein
MIIKKEDMKMVKKSRVKVKMKVLFIYEEK